MIDLSNRVLNELLHFVAGEALGADMTREVYAHPQNPDWVIKIENKVATFQNVKEWEFWKEYNRHATIAKWLAPCHFISESGSFLIQSRTRPLVAKELPKRLPTFLTDHKPENFGMLNGRVVCHDYGFTFLSAETKLRNWRAYDK